MARRHRIEYAGVCYHVINRGNCRAWVFENEGAKDVFDENETDASNRGLAQRLMMSSATCVRKMLDLLRKVKGK